MYDNVHKMIVIVQIYYIVPDMNINIIFRNIDDYKEWNNSCT